MASVSGDRMILGADRTVGISEDLVGIPRTKIHQVSNRCAIAGLGRHPSISEKLYIKDLADWICDKLGGPKGESRPNDVTNLLINKDSLPVRFTINKSTTYTLGWIFVFGWGDQFAGGQLIKVESNLLGTTITMHGSFARLTTDATSIWHRTSEEEEVRTVVGSEQYYLGLLREWESSGHNINYKNGKLYNSNDGIDTVTLIRN